MCDPIHVQNVYNRVFVAVCVFKIFSLLNRLQKYIITSDKLDQSVKKTSSKLKTVIKKNHIRNQS